MITFRKENRENLQNLDQKSVYVRKQLNKIDSNKQHEFR